MNINSFETEWKWGKLITIMIDNAGKVELELYKGYNYIYLTGLMVAPDSRKKGLGTALMKKAEEITKELGFDEIQLKVQQDHTFQYEWYVRLGYKLIIDDQDEGYKYLRKQL